jgi:hypothetical protein
VSSSTDGCPSTRQPGDLEWDPGIVNDHRDGVAPIRTGNRCVEQVLKRRVDRGGTLGLDRVMTGSHGVGLHQGNAAQLVQLRVTAAVRGNQGLGVTVALANPN